MNKTLISLALALAACASHGAECTAQRFTIVKEAARVEGGLRTFVGQVRNDNAIACGVELSLDTFDAKDSPVSADRFWPASVSNIAPGATTSFTYMLSRDASRAAKNYSLKPVDSKVWK